MESVTLEQIIRRYIHLPTNPSSKGWYSVLCKVCNDHGRKGERAAFKFEDDVVAYHCFNCGHSTVYDPNKHTNIPYKMEQVLTDFGVPDSEWQKVVFDSLANKDKRKTGEKKKQYTSIEPPEILIPECFYFLKDATPKDKWGVIARSYLSEDRGIDPDSYPFMLTKKPNDPRMYKWVGRVIIPIYKGDKPIFYMGRGLVQATPKKYESPSVSKENVMYGFDRLFDNNDVPLYIVEGWFDAFAIDGVAILGNKLTKGHIEWLNRSRKKKVYIPDRLGDGIAGAEQALEAGWHISTPDVGQCKDMSEAVQKYGKLYVMKTIADHTAIGVEAETKLRIYCM